MNAGIAASPLTPAFPRITDAGREEFEGVNGGAIAVDDAHSK
jgi:hypothetical protein